MRRNNLFDTSSLKMIAAVLCVALVGGSVFFGCEQEEPDPAKRIFKQAIKALGGMKKVSGWQTRIEKGLLVSYNPGWGTLQANATYIVQKPDKVKIDNDFSAYDHPFYWTYYYNSGESWAVVNLTVRQHPRVQAEMEDYVKTMDGIAYYLSACDTFFQVAEVPDDSLFAGAGINRVGCVHNGDTILFDFSMESQLLVRRIEEGGTQHTIFEDYRKTNGPRMPFRINVHTNGTLAQEYKWDEITFNEPVDAATFEEDRPKPSPAEEDTG